MPGAAANEHHIYIWDAHELLEELHKLKEGTHAAIEYNDQLKAAVDADVIALTQLVMSGAKIARQIRLLGILGRAYIKESGGKAYIIFKGDPTLRPNLQGTRYLASNAKVRCFVVGSKDILTDAAKATKVAIIAFIALDIITELTSDKPSFMSLGVRVGSDALQAALAAYGGALAGVAMTGVGAPAVVAFVVVVVVGFAVGAALTALDRRFQLTERARARMMAWEQKELPILRHDAAAAWNKAKGYGSQAEAWGERTGAAAWSQARTYGREVGAWGGREAQAAEAEWYKVDRYYQSIAHLLADQPRAGARR